MHVATRSDSGDSLRERILTGDGDALAGLVDRLYVNLARIALLYLGSTADAYEALQGLPRLARHALVRLERTESAERWLLGLHLAALRARALSAGAIATTPADPRRGASAVPPGERIHGGELDGLVRAVVSALPVDQREVVILRDLEGLGAGEVGRLLGRSESEQRRLLQRARTCLLRALEGHASFEQASAPAVA